MTFFSQQHCDCSLVDPHLATVEEVSVEEGLSCGMRVSRQIRSEEAIKVVSENAHSEIKVDLDHHGGRNSVEMEEVDLFGDILLDQPPLRVFSHHVSDFDGEVIGQKEGRFDFPMTGDRNWANILAILR